jgi:hypothetical protein
MASTDERRFSWSDVERWVTAGLLTVSQAERIRAELDSTAAVQLPEKRHGLNIVTVAYYFGGFMILLAYTFYMGLQWGQLDRGSQLAVSVITIGVLVAVGAFIRSRGFTTGGSLLIFAGTGIVPLAVYVLERMTGVWPDESATNYRDFYRVVAPGWVYMELVALAAAVVAIRVIRFPLLALLAAFWIWFLSMDLVRWIAQSQTWTWSDREQWASTVVGLGMIVLGIILQRLARRDYSIWFYVFGHLIVLAHFSALTLSREGGILLLAYPAVYLAFVIASVLLQRRVFLIFGALGCYGYATYLAYRVFQGSLGFVFMLASVGLVIILSTVAYQRFIGAWLEQRLARFRLSRATEPASRT